MTGRNRVDPLERVDSELEYLVSRLDIGRLFGHVARPELEMAAVGQPQVLRLVCPPISVDFANVARPMVDITVAQHLFHRGGMLAKVAPHHVIATDPRAQPGIALLSLPKVVGDEHAEQTN